MSRNSWEDVPKDTILVSHRADTGHAMMRILSAIPGPAAEVTPTASTGTTVKGQSKVEGGGKWFVVDYLLDALKYYSSQQGRTQWPRESLWYPGLASSLPASASAASAGASLHSTEWKQGQTRLRQKFGSSSNFFWCFPPRMETKSGEARSPFRSLNTIRSLDLDFRGLVLAWPPFYIATDGCKTLLKVMLACVRIKRVDLLQNHCWRRHHG